MGWTNTQTYLTIAFLFILVITGLAKVGTDLINKDRINLSEENINYINQIKGTSIESGFENIANTSSSQTSKIDLLDSDDNKSVLSSSDFLSTLYIKKERASRPVNLLLLVYNIPSTIVTSLLLPVVEFVGIINILVFFVSVGLVILIWKQWVNP